ncbi:hypothetical protein [Mucilaginibacter xinganensis]|uniref:Uncharacterized protein n=1 Tax=Mucilaginibacter xinganensis TaxID=1234841 RepID=A0A223NSP3_9SPHI|nr:hypothetical protein [Mucilaginibacter xinganensis]ASU32925.1 hypothetical protein MuYL_1025 [Mucilaginibacter xinganensis]
MGHRKPLERRTFTQDRYEILIKRQRSGKATFNELTELDEIVNRDPAIREIVLIENNFIQRIDDNNTPRNEPEQDIVKTVPRQSFTNWLKAVMGRIFTSQIAVIKNGAFVV